MRKSTRHPRRSSRGRGAGKASLRSNRKNVDKSQCFNEGFRSTPESVPQDTFGNSSVLNWECNPFSNRDNWRNTNEVQYQQPHWNASFGGDGPTFSGCSFWNNSSPAMPAFTFQPSVVMTFQGKQNIEVVHMPNLFQQNNNFFNQDVGRFMFQEERNGVHRNLEYFGMQPFSNNSGSFPSGSFSGPMLSNLERLPRRSFDDFNYQRSDTVASELHGDCFRDSFGGFENYDNSPRGVNWETNTQEFALSPEYNRTNGDFSCNQNSHFSFNGHMSIDQSFTPQESLKWELPSRSSYFLNNDEDNFIARRQSSKRVRREPEQDNFSYVNKTFPLKKKRYQAKRFSDPIRRTSLNTKIDFESSSFDKYSPTAYSVSGSYGEDYTSQFFNKPIDHVVESPSSICISKVRKSVRIRAAHVKSQQLLYIYFEQALRGFCSDTPSVEKIREIFQELWIQFAFQFFKRFWQLFGFSVATVDSTNILSPVICQTESVCLQERVNEIKVQSCSNLFKFEMATTEKISEVIQRDTFNKKLLSGLIPMLLEAVFRDTPLGLGLLNASDEDKMKFKCTLIVLRDQRENPPPGRCGVRMILKWSDEIDDLECLPEHVISKYRHLSLIFEKLGRKYIHNKIKQWLRECKDVDWQSFDKILTKLKRRRRGPQKWKKFRRKWRLEGRELTFADIVYGVEKSVLSPAPEDLPEKSNGSLPRLNKHIRFVDMDDDEEKENGNLTVPRMEDTEPEIQSAVCDVVEEMIQWIEQEFLTAHENEELNQKNNGEAKKEISCVDKISINDLEEDKEEVSVLLLDEASSTDSGIPRDASDHPRIDQGGPAE